MPSELRDLTRTVRQDLQQRYFPIVQDSITSSQRDDAQEVAKLEAIINFCRDICNGNYRLDYNVATGNDYAEVALALRKGVVPPQYRLDSETIPDHEIVQRLAQAQVIIHSLKLADDYHRNLLNSSSKDTSPTTLRRFQTDIQILALAIEGKSPSMHTTPSERFQRDDQDLSLLVLQNSSSRKR
jgi:hypothetical protein